MMYFLTIFMAPNLCFCERKSRFINCPSCDYLLLNCVQVNVGGIIMMTDSKSDEPEDLIEPLPGKEYNQ